MEGRYTICENYARPETGHRHYGFITPGAYAQYAVYSEKSLDKMPDSVSFRAGALVDTAGVSLHGLELTGITPGGSVAVIGPGPIGLLTMRLAHAMGAGQIIAVGRGARLQAALRSFADVLVDIEEQDPIAAVRQATSGRGVDEVMECSGAPGTFNQAIRMVKKGGRIALLGVPPNHVIEEVPFKYVVHNEIMITGVRANPNVSHKILNMIAGGQLAMEDLITHTFRLEEFAQALDTFVHRRQGAIKVVIEPNGVEA
jgi:L-iditol 2-dehydrogenase